MPERRGRHRADGSPAAAALAAAAVACALVAGAGAASAAVPRATAVPVPPHALQVTLADAVPVATLQDPRALPEPGPAAGVVPARVVIPDIGVDAALPPLGLDEQGVLLPPADLDTAGWYEGSAVPGEVGPAVLAGHVDDTARPGVFARLAELRPGARIDVVLSDGSTTSYRMTRAVHTAKSDFPTVEVYGPTPNSQLRLITCTGPYDAGQRQYRDNLVVFAVPAG